MRANIAKHGHNNRFIRDVYVRSSPMFALAADVGYAGRSAISLQKASKSGDDASRPTCQAPRSDSSHSLRERVDQTGTKTADVQNSFKLNTSLHGRFEPKVVNNALCWDWRR